MRYLTYRKQQGLTLIELMVSLALSLVLLGGLIQLFVSNKQSYQLSDELARMQESARYAAHLLKKDLRLAGYTGCTSRDLSGLVINNTLDGPAGSFSPENGIEGWESSGTAYGSYSIVTNGAVADASESGWSTAESVTLDDDTFSVANSDIVRVWHLDGNPVLVNNITPGVAQTVINTTIDATFGDGDILLVTDCSTVDIVQACNVTVIGGGASVNAVTSAGCTPGNIVTKGLLNSGGAHVAQLAGWVYYVGKRSNTATNPPSLYRQEVSQNAAAETAQEIVEGVESLQFLYGEDTDTSAPDGVANRYVNANSVSDWNSVVSVRIELLMQSSRTDLVDGTQTFTFNGANVSATDGRLRYPFITTVSLRNRSS